MTLAALTLAALVPMPATAQTSPLDDSGQTICYNASDAANATCDITARPGQDARFGRDAAYTKGTLTKIGGGVAGFDFTAFNVLDGSQNPIGVGPAPGTHACVKDNVTGLIWSTETLDMTWTGATASYPGNGSGSYSRCGYSTGWRLPTRRELLSIAHYGTSTAPVIDPQYFPNTRNSWYWTADSFSGFSGDAWLVDFLHGVSNHVAKTSAQYVRLVRSGP